MRSAAFRANFYVVFRDSHFAAIVAVIRGNPVPPPELTGYAPVFYVFHPVKIYLRKPVGRKFNAFLSYHVDSGFSKRFHFHEPLFGNDRFDGMMASVTMPDVVRKRFDFDERADGF